MFDVFAAEQAVSIAAEHPEDIQNLLVWVIIGLTGIMGILISVIAKMLFARLERFESIMRQDVSTMRTHVQTMDTRLAAVETTVALISGEDRREFDVFEMMRKIRESEGKTNNI